MGRKKLKKKNANSQELRTIKSIRELFERGKTKEALKQAKILLRESTDPELEPLLAEIYQKRIQELFDAGLIKEAKNLITIAEEKCPNHKHSFSKNKPTIFHSPLTQEDVDILLTELSAAEGNQERQNELHDVLTSNLADIRLLMNSPMGESGHPLKKEAAIIWRCMQIVSSPGLEKDKEDGFAELSSISRRSPLSPWCWFIRALNAFYSNNDDLTVELLEKIPDNTPLRHGKELLISKIKGEKKPKSLSTKKMRDIWHELSAKSLRYQWHDVLHALDSNPKFMIRKMQKFFENKWFQSPFFKRYGVCLILKEIITEDIESPELNDFLAKQYLMEWGDKGKGYHLMDANLFEVYIYTDLKYSDIEEGYRLIIDKCDDVFSNKELASLYATLGEIASSKEKEIRSLTPFVPFLARKIIDESSNSNAYYEKACKLDPQPEYFAGWVSSLKRNEKKTKEIEAALSRWQNACPWDSTPLIHLFENAERRKALNKSMDYLEKAEALDRVNPQVREARQRLTWGMIKKHVKQGKFHLVHKDLTHVQNMEMPAIKQELFKGVGLLVRHSKGEPVSLEENPVLYTLVLHHLTRDTQLEMYKDIESNYPLPSLQTEEELKTYYQFCHGLNIIHDSPCLPETWLAYLPRWIREAGTLSEDLLLQISQSILQEEDYEAVWEATKRGLAKEGPSLFEFLFYRGVLLSHAVHDEKSADECLCAAIRISRARGNYLFEQKVLQLYQSLFLIQFREEMDEFMERVNALTENKINKIVNRERKRKSLNIFSNKGTWNHSSKNAAPKNPSKKKKGHEDREQNEEESWVDDYGNQYLF